MNLGYRHDLENRASLSAKSVQFSPALCGDLPKEVSHRGWIKIENQGAMNSCAGNAMSTCLEVCEYIQTGGDAIQLSRMFCYLEGQKQYGGYGRDNGCSIEGVADAAKLVGVCREQAFPYPGYYDTRIPQSAEAEAKDHKIKTWSELDSYEKIKGFIGSGVGAVVAGVPWYDSLAESSGLVTRVAGGMRGWHAIPFVGYDSGGNLDSPNSHGIEYGDRGWSMYAPQVIQYFCKIGCVFLGISDLETYGKRTIPTYRGMTA